MEYRILITVESSECRSDLHKTGESFIVDDVCPPVCHELWNNIYPMLYALGNGAELDCGSERKATFHTSCPDGGRVRIKAERLPKD